MRALVRGTLSAMGPALRLRSVALLPASAYAAHSLRYGLAYGASAPVQLRAQGHAYLAVAPVALAALLAAAVVEAPALAG